MSWNINAGYGQLAAFVAANVCPTFGNILLVLPDGENNLDKIQQIFNGNPDGKVSVYTTVAAAVDAATTNNDDVILLSTNASHSLSAMLTISKSRLHFASMDVFGRLYGQRAKLSMGVTAAVTDVFAVKNTGVGNTFTGIKFMSSNTLTQNVGTFGEGGEYTTFRNCEFYNSAKLDSDTHAELILNGDSAQFFDCTFGSMADAVSGDKVRPAILMTTGTVTAGAVARDVLFRGCKFWKKAGGTTTSFIKLVDNDLERFMELENCTFIANKLGSVPAVAINSATLTKSQILLTGSTIACNCTKIGTATGIINGTPARVATATIGIQAT
jgi:hypothetical protein